MFREHGATVLDADVLAREVVEPGRPALTDIAARFPGVVDTEGRLDRRALGAHVFGNPEERAALDALVHPRIHELFREKLAALHAQGVPTVLYDAALLIENKLHEGMDGVILVAVPRDLQLSRLMAREGLSLDAAEARLAAQLPLEAKKPFARWIVDNSGSLDDTRRQVEVVWTDVKREQTAGMLPRP